MSCETASLLPCPFCENPAVEIQYNGPNEEQIKSALTEGHEWDAAYFVACWCGCTGPERSEEGAAAEAWNRRSKPVASGVEVKPLEWVKIFEWGRDLKADTILGGYTISIDGPGAGGSSNLWMAGADTDTFEVFDTLREAKAAAEADYRNRILSALLPKATAPVVSEPLEVEWVVNEIAELGVKIGDQFFFCYKGYSLTYTNDDGGPFVMMEGSTEPMHWRPVFKREFGECVHPINYVDPTKIGTVSLDDSDNWVPLPAAKEINAPLIASPQPQLRAVTEEWQPIDTAPRDGREVVLWCGQPVCGRISNDYLDPERTPQGWTFDVTWPGMTEPTHWIPIPAEPFGEAAMKEA